MAKLDALKEKLAVLKLKLTEALQKVPVLKKFAVPAAEKPAAPPAPDSIGAIYRSGGTLTRIQVICFFIFLVATITSSAYVGKLLFKRLRSSKEHEKLVEDYSHGLGDIKRRIEENASVLALGKFTVSAYISDERSTAVTLDLWLRVTDMEAANFVQSHDAILRDRTTEALNEIYLQKTNLLTEQGKEAAKRKIREFLNQVLPKGQVEEIYFHNMVIQ